MKASWGGKKANDPTTFPQTIQINYASKTPAHPFHLIYFPIRSPFSRMFFTSSHLHLFKQPPFLGSKKQPNRASSSRSTRPPLSLSLSLSVPLSPRLSVHSSSRASLDAWVIARHILNCLPYSCGSFCLFSCFSFAILPTLCVSVFKLPHHAVLNMLRPLATCGISSRGALLSKVAFFINL